MARFIKLHNRKNESITYLVRIDSIITINDDETMSKTEDFNYREISLSHGGYLYVKETAEEILQLIREQHPRR